MNNLTLNPKTHVIITFTKSHHFITQKQYEWLINQGSGIKFTIDSNELRTNNIAEILTVQKYYETFPEKQTKNFHQPYTPLPGNVFTRASKNGREHFMKGLRRITPKGKFLREMEAGGTTGKPTAYNPTSRLERVQEGEIVKFVYKPLNNSNEHS